jgi:hypothetical protein
MGLRLAATFNFMDSQGDAPEPLLAHATMEIPLEAHMTFGPVEGYLQAVPRIGWLDLSGQGYDGSTATVTAGLMLVAGMRFGRDAIRIGAGYARLFHPTFSGWSIDAEYIQRIGESGLFSSAAGSR